MTRAIKVRHLLAALVAATALAPPTVRADAVPAADWTGTWEAAPTGTTRALPGDTVRNVVHTSIGGSVLRVRVTNRFGSAPLRLGSVTVALQRRGRPGSPRAVPGTVRHARFGGAPSATVPTGRDAYTDPVRLRVPAGANLLVSLHTPDDSGPATYHRSALRKNFVARGGDHTGDEGGGAFRTTVRSSYYVTGIDVLDARAAGSVATLGDSITDGIGSSPGTDHRWPDRLAERLRALPPRRRLGVLNAGISGNHVLRENVGPSALDRLEDDVLSRAGVRALIVLEGVNDIKDRPGAAHPAALEAAYRNIVVRAHARGVRVIGATITPYRGHRSWTEAGETVRTAVNAVIRDGGLFDAVADFDAVVRDHAQPQRIRSDYDPGDHLHFNDTGMRELARAVDLAALTPRGPRPARHP
ncbi:SGNH/GDSL hydrolase family protein [Streptomyces sp. NPDC059786]|uniref:SGNH/GDSL hydrolase family protein n=1 Tax=Streptomyces sp. NPDC059786 TaxID=3346946 RepID=UPI003664A574